MVVGGVVAVRHCGGDKRPPLAGRVATFNIEHFPKDQRQIDGAFDELIATGASVIAVQEITDPVVFMATVHERFNEYWGFVHDDPHDGLVGAQHYLGVLYDKSAWEMTGQYTHDDTRFGGYDLPILEVRFWEVDGNDTGRAMTVFVVHFRPGTDGRAVRHKQFAALAKVIARERITDDTITVMGDFNATEPGDRDDLAALARGADLRWASEPLACTAFWDRDDGCPRSRLDQVLISARPREVSVGGACATEGCERQDSCPAYVDEVSDHCPVVVDF
jgi:endonuclease/exonuclease/phosphatase family metal-dependent hydrolase